MRGLLCLLLVVWLFTLYVRYQAMKAAGFEKTPGFGVWFVARRSFPLSLFPPAGDATPGGAIHYPGAS